MLMEQEYPRTLIDVVADDVMVVRRLSEDGLHQKVLVARLSYEAKVPPKDFEVKLDGTVGETEFTFNLEADRGTLTGDFKTRDVLVSEWNVPDTFRSVLLECPHQRKNRFRHPQVLRHRPRLCHRLQRQTD